MGPEFRVTWYLYVFGETSNMYLLLMMWVNLMRAVLTWHVCGGFRDDCACSISVFYPLATPVKGTWSSKLELGDKEKGQWVPYS